MFIVHVQSETFSSTKYRTPFKEHVTISNNENSRPRLNRWVLWTVWRKYRVFIKYCFFPRILKYIPDSGLSRSPLGVKRQHYSRTGRVQNNHNILRKNTIFNEHPVYPPYPPRIATPSKVVTFCSFYWHSSSDKYLWGAKYENELKKECCSYARSYMNMYLYSNYSNNYCEIVYV